MSLDRDAGLSPPTQRSPRVGLGIVMLLLPMFAGCSGCRKQSPEQSSVDRESDELVVDSARDEETAIPDDKETQGSSAGAADKKRPSAKSTPPPAAGKPVEPSAAGESGDAGGTEDSSASAARAGQAAKRGASPPASRQTKNKGGSADPVAALRRGRELFEKSQEKSKSGNHQSAYQDACTAWELVNPCGAVDAECRSLADKIFRRLDDLAEAANRQAKAQGGTEDDKTLIDK